MIVPVTEKSMVLSPPALIDLGDDVSQVARGAGARAGVAQAVDGEGGQERPRFERLERPWSTPAATVPSRSSRLAKPGMERRRFVEDSRMRNIDAVSFLDATPGRGVGLVANGARGDAGSPSRDGSVTKWPWPRSVRCQPGPIPPDPTSRGGSATFDRGPTLQPCLL